MPVSSELPIRGGQEELAFEEEYTQLVEEGKWLSVVWTSLGPLPRWVPGPTTRWAHGTTRPALHGT
jgi:hypothetical protein